MTKGGFTNIILGVCASIFWVSCGGDDDSVVARYKKQELRIEQLQQYIPAEATGEDSIRYAGHYIDQWLKSQAIADIALQRIPNLEKQLEFKVADYRSKLIMAEFTNYIIADSLDTIVSPNEIETYYKTYPENFISKENLFSYLYVVCKSENTGKVDEWMRSSRPEDLAAMLEWAKANALEYKVDSSYAPDGVVAEISKGYFGDLRKAERGRIVRWNGVIQGERRRYYFKMLEAIRAGDPLPIPMAKARIDNIILNERKVKLIEATEKDIVKKARANNYIQE